MDERVQDHPEEKKEKWQLLEGRCNGKLCCTRLREPGRPTGRDSERTKVRIYTDTQTE